MTRLALTSALALGLLACGGAAPSPAPPAAAPKAPASPEQACFDEASATRTPRADAPEAIVVAHVLVRHADLRRPEGATRTRGQACLRAREAREKLLAGAEWADVVREYSDSGHDTLGSLGRVAPSDLDAAFGAAAFALGVDELSHVVETPRGFHVIARTE